MAPSSSVGLSEIIPRPTLTKEISSSMVQGDNVPNFQFKPTKPERYWKGIAGRGGGLGPAVGAATLTYMTGEL